MTKPIVKAPATIIIPGASIIVGSTTVPWTHPSRPHILAQIKAKNWAKVVELVKPRAAVMAYGKGAFKISIKDNLVTYKGEPVSTLLNKRLIEMAQQELPIDNLLRFIDKTRKNPNKKAQEELYGFLEYGKLPITQDGTFLARKIAKADFWDKHTGRTHQYKPGAIVKMDRKAVNSDSSVLCSSGLHVYSVEYSKQFFTTGDKILLVEVDPRDVCAVPPDYNNTKMRVCKMRVLQVLSNEEAPEFFSHRTLNTPPVQESWF